jgi:hypothetical protein
MGWDVGGRGWGGHWQAGVQGDPAAAAAAAGGTRSCATKYTALLLLLVVLLHAEEHPTCVRFESEKNRPCCH